MAGSKRTGAVVWPGDETMTFSDALTAVRRRIRADAIEEPLKAVLE